MSNPFAANTSPNKAALQEEINAQKQKLDETLDYVERGPVKDALRVIIPMQHDQLDLMRRIVEEM